MSSHSRTKGANFERDLVHRFREAMPGAEVRRGLQSRGAEVADVEVPCFWVEAKAYKKARIQAAMDQAVAEAPPGKMAVVVSKDDRRPPLATLLLDDFLELVGEWWRRRDA